MTKPVRPILRERIFNIVFKSDTAAGRAFDTILLWLILFSIASVCLESVAVIRSKYGAYIHFAEWFFTITFTVEYMLRIYASNKPWRYIFSFYGIIDFISFTPFYFSLLFAGAQYLVVFRALRLLRAFRILKLTRFSSEGKILVDALKGSLHKIVVFLSAVITIVCIIGTLMYVIEGDKSGFTSIPASIYWAIVTITTVGYGDISPQSPLGQFLASILMVIGYGILAVPTGIVSVEMAKASQVAVETCPNCNTPILQVAAKFCPHCGKELMAK
jgi:voltage-gated potassium channel